MAYVKFSSNFLRGTSQSLQGRVINLKSIAYQPAGNAANPQMGIMSGAAIVDQYGNLGAGNLGVLRIMSGTMPTSPEIYTKVPPVGTTVLFEANSVQNGTDFNPTGNNWYTDPTVLSTFFLSVAATGVATWFWLLTVNYVGTNVVVHTIIGDVGTVGSGADMEMFNTSLVAGQFLRVINLNLKIPVNLFG